MSGGNSSNEGRGSGGGGEGDGGGGWGSTLVKLAGAAAAAAGLYALLTSSAAPNTEQQVPVGAGRVLKEADDDDPWSLHHQETPSQGGWTKPVSGWVKLNVDGSRVHEGPFASAGCGGVLRDASGAWLLGFARKLDSSCEVHETEIKGILTGLRLAWEMNVEKLVVECDNGPVVRMVENELGCKDNHPQFEVIDGIRKLRSDPKWQVKLVSISRSANRVADRLAKDARDLPSDDLRRYRFPPGNCTRLLLEDAQGVTY